MDTHPASHPSQLFELRMWLEYLGDGKTEWRGQVKHVLSGEVRYFRDWQNMIEIVSKMLPTSEASTSRRTDEQ